MSRKVTKNTQRDTETKLGKLKHRIHEIKKKEQQKELEDYIDTAKIQNRPSRNYFQK